MSLPSLRGLRVGVITLVAIGALQVGAGTAAATGEDPGTGFAATTLPAPPAPPATHTAPPKPLPTCRALRRSPVLARRATARRRALCRVTLRVPRGAKRSMAIAPYTPGVARAKTYGPTGLKRTLVLYNSTGSFDWLGEMYAYGAGNLATHFGQVTTLPAVDYTAGRIATYDAVIYIGSTYGEAMPADLINDLRTTGKPIIWSGFNVDQLSGTAGSASANAFISRYGWDAATSYVTTDLIPTVTYKGRQLTRSIFNGAGVYGPRIVDPGAVSVLATGQCTLDGVATACQPVAQTTGSDVPWAIRSANLTFVSEIPFSYISERDRYLVFADLLYNALAPTTTPIKQAAVRLEDVTPMSDPNQLKAVADYLYSQRVPFSVALVANYVDPKGVYNGGVAQNVTLDQKPAVVSALRYMLARGGTLIQHGTTHQYSTVANPYNGVSVDDFEFFRSLCSSTAGPPLTFVDCASSPDTWVQLLGPLPEDSQTWAANRVARGRSLIYSRALLPMPSVFEFPHYAGSMNAYKAVRSYYATRYERTLNFGGQLLPGADPTRFFGQFFPYATWDIWGSKVLPENIGNFEPEAFNNHPPVLASEIVDRAAANQVVTQSTASFFFHPIFDINALKEIVTGIKAQGYTFVAAGGLK